MLSPEVVRFDGEIEPWSGECAGWGGGALKQNRVLVEEVAAEEPIIGEGGDSDVIHHGGRSEGALRGWVHRRRGRLGQRARSVPPPRGACVGEFGRLEGELARAVHLR